MKCQAKTANHFRLTGNSRGSFHFREEATKERQLKAHRRTCLHCVIHQNECFMYCVYLQMSDQYLELLKISEKVANDSLRDS
jgi:hypothetical protein